MVLQYTKSSNPSGEKAMQSDKNSEMGLVFNLQRYSVHDGPGIRTIVFFKGCPLRCPWCSNPEGISHTPELSYSNTLCRRCGQCEEVCPAGALSRDGEGYILVDRDLCTACAACADVCPASALKVFGKQMSAETVLREVVKDTAFYRRSGGGLTVSGGEPLARPVFLMALLRGAKESHNLHVALETTLCASEETVRAVIPYVDYLFADIKVYNGIRHQQTVGVPNAQILDNIRLLAKELPENKELVLRLPLIPTFNDDQENIRDTAAFIRSLPRDIPLEILPYHEYGSGKYPALGKEYRLAGKGLAVQDTASAAMVERIFKEHGVRVITT